MAKRIKSIRFRFGERVKKLRKRPTKFLPDGMSQADLAESCELHRSYICGIERGKRNVSLVNIEKIADGLGVTMSELFEGL